MLLLLTLRIYSSFENIDRLIVSNIINIRYLNMEEFKIFLTLSLINRILLKINRYRYA